MFVENTRAWTIAGGSNEDAVDYEGRAPLESADDELRGHGALYRIYDTFEGQLFLAAPKPREWAPLASVLGLEPDDRFADPAGRKPTTTNWRSNSRRSCAPVRPRNGRQHCLRWMSPA